MLLFYPRAIPVDPPLETQGAYSQGYPKGAVVHYTAGGPGLGALSSARDNGFTYFLIDEDGDVHQGFPLSDWGSHAGKSSYPGIGDHVSEKLVGIEVACAGLVKPDGSGNFLTWWGDTITQDQVRLVPTKRDNQTPGAYQVFNEAQEAALIDLLLWLKLNNPDVFSFDFVLGHDEVSPGRKEDPGGSLSMTMPMLRARLRSCLTAQTTVPPT